MSRLSNTIFQGRSTDAMIAIDAYEISKSTPTNNVYDTVRGIYADTIGKIQTDKGTGVRLSELIVRAKTTKMSKADLLNGALSAMGTDLPNLLGKLGGSLKDRVAETAGTLLGDDAKRAVEVLYNDAGMLIEASNVKDARDLLDFIGGVTNADLIRFVDIEAESAILAAVAQELMAYNAPDILDDLIETSSSERVKLNVYSYIGATAISGSDLPTVNKILDKIGLNKFLEFNPDAIDQILSSYTKGFDGVESYPQRRELLVSTLQRIDPHWNKVLRSGSYVTNLGRYSLASDHARIVLSIQEPDRTYCMAAKAYTSRSVNSVVKELYPDAYIS